MSRVVVKGSAPGFFRVELEGTELAVEISTAGNAYQTAHELQAFMQVLADAVPSLPAENVVVDKRPSKAPKGGL